MTKIEAGSAADQVAVSMDDVLDAYQVVSRYAHRTPVMTCETLDRIAGCRLYFKCENLQKVGAFKYRGAIHAISKLGSTQRKNGVITHSSGNHGQALALAARTFGIPATVVMPSTAPRVKQDAVRGYGATVVFCEPTLEARESTVAELQAREGTHLVPPFDHPHIIAGQGTAALELVQEMERRSIQLDAIVAPVGGGGLISGTCIVAQHQHPPIPVIASEPMGADDAYRSKQAGQLVPQTDPQTIADGLLTSLGDWTWPFVRDQVSQVVTVSDASIVEAMKLLWSRAKLLVEPSAATSMAAVLGGQLGLPANANVGMILSGGNVDLDRLPWAQIV